jgi:hypothetical protein
MSPPRGPLICPEPVKSNRGASKCRDRGETPVLVFSTGVKKVQLKRYI